MSDVYTEAAKILAAKIGILVDQARAIIMVNGYRSFQGEKRLGPLPDVLVNDGWVNRSFIISSGCSEASVDSLVTNGFLVLRPDEQAGRLNANWIRTADNLSTAISEAFEEIERRGMR